MKLYQFLIAGLALVPLAGFAQESDLSYTWVEVDYINVDIDEFGEGAFDDLDDGDGWAIRGSYGFATSPFGFADSWFVFADYSETETDVTVRDDFGILQPADTDVIRFNIGAGMAVSVNDMSDLVFRLAYSDIDVDDFNVGGTSSSAISDLDDDSSDGFTLDGVWRGQIAPAVELSAGLRYTDIEETDNLAFIGNALFEINQDWGINVFADVGDELSQYGVGARWTF